MKAINAIKDVRVKSEYLLDKTGPVSLNLEAYNF